jgi:hypothetical protein
MNEHESTRMMLALAAAGALDPAELRRVNQHAQVCEVCRRELETWSVYARGLRGLPQPSVPVDLVGRTQARIFEERAAASSRRRDDLLLAALAVFSWMTTLAFWALARVFTGGVVDVLGANLVSALAWSLIWAVLVWITATAAAVTLGRQRHLRRAI